MKAFLLAAGRGTRLRPLTDKTPKCLLPVGGRPLMGIWLDSLARAGVSEVLVNLHHMADQVRTFLARRQAPPRVHAVYEPELLGSLGTLQANRGFVAAEEAFLVCYGDGLTNYDLTDIVRFHRSHGGPASIALFETDRPWECGIIELGKEGVVRSFEEKPERPKGNWANAGIYVFAPAVLGLVRLTPPADIGYQLLPRLVGVGRGRKISAYYRDIGDPASYAAAEKEWLGTGNGDHA